MQFAKPTKTAYNSLMNKKCYIAGCDREAKVKGLCNKHYIHNRRYGTPFSEHDMSGFYNKHISEYNSYRSMKNRCLCQTGKNYPKWGGRGIKICDRWLEKPNGFRNFYKDMGDRPEGYTLDRIDVNGDYCPENCRWADKWTQMGNTRRAVKHGTQGVHYRKERNKGKAWCANFKFRDIRVTKCFSTKEEAIAQREQWEKEYRREDKETPQE